MMAVILRLLKPIVMIVFKLVAPILNLLGVNAKEWYELAYWKAAKSREGSLSNTFYEEIYTTYTGLTPDYYRDKRILDIGCGPRGSLEWATMAAERIGLDPLVEQYRTLGIDAHAMSYVDAPAENMPFEDNYFDIVTSINSLDHVDNLDQTVAEIKRVIAVGGELIIIVHIHDEPTIAEPVRIPWSFTKQFQTSFEVLEEVHYELHPEHHGAAMALKTKIPFDHDNPQSRYGVLYARLSKSHSLN